MLRISDLTFSYQDQPLLENLNLALTGQEAVAIIGDNGAGKTTLLRLIAGELRPDDGSVKATGDIGFLKQTQEDLEDKSGGERTQMRLAELFRQKPEILLLDEPTNNLDHESKTWLLRSLYKYHGLVLVASHDRDFLEAVAEKIIYLHDGKAEVFLGDYVSFCEHQMRKQHEKRRSYERFRQEKMKLERQVKSACERAQKSKHRHYDKNNDESKLHFNNQKMAAQNNMGKFLRATQSRIEQITDMEKPHERRVYNAEVSSNFLHDRKLLELTNLTKSYGKKKLFENSNLTIRTGERVRICGRNGSGKSTLFRIILGQVDADSGKVWTAANVEIGYISQDVMGLDLEKSFLEQNEGVGKTEVLRAAATMDFVPQDMARPTGKLSRGQQTKLAILKLILRPVDLVIIDEITNHIDIRARENIEFALKNYRGAILAATHDEAFAREVGFGGEVELG